MPLRFVTMQQAVRLVRAVVGKLEKPDQASDDKSAEANEAKLNEIKNRLQSVVSCCFGQFKQTIDSIECFWKTIQHNHDVQRNSKVVINSLMNIDFEDLYSLEQIDRLVSFGEVSGIFEKKGWSDKFIQNPLLVMHFMGIE